MAGWKSRVRQAQERRSKSLLPAVAGAATLEEEISTKADAGHGTILLVEDRADVRLLTLTILKSLGYSVLQAESGVSALKAAESCEYRIDLLLTDVVMPGMSGTELAKRLRVLQPSIRVLFISGYTEDERFASAGSGSQVPTAGKAIHAVGTGGEGTRSPGPVIWRARPQAGAG